MLETEYLGVSLTPSGISDTKTLTRLRKARTRLLQLARVGLNSRGFPPHVNRRLYLSLVRYITEYAIHLTRLRPAAQLDYLSLERLFIHTVVGPTSNRSPAAVRFSNSSPLNTAAAAYGTN